MANRIDTAGKILGERIAPNAAKSADKRKDLKKTVVSLTDPNALLGRNKLKVFRPLYTLHSMVDRNDHGDFGGHSIHEWVLQFSGLSSR